MSTLVPATLAPPRDEHTRALIKERIRYSNVHVLNGDIVVFSPGARVTFAHRKRQANLRDMVTPSRFVLTGIPLPLTERPYQRSVILALYDIAASAIRENAPDRISKKYILTSFVTRLTYQRNGGEVSNNGPCFRATGQVKINDSVVDVLMEILS